MTDPSQGTTLFDDLVRRTCSTPSLNAFGLGGEPLLKDALRQFRIGFALRRLHHLPHEERHQLRLATLEPPHLRRMRVTTDGAPGLRQSVSAG